MKTVKKTHWLRNTLIVLVICGLAGTVLAAVLFTRDNSRNYALSTVQFSFDGAAEGKAPNGYPFDVSGFTADEVLEAALEASGLTGTYTADQLRESLTVTGNYPEKIAEQMTKYVSLLDKNADNQASVSDYHATEYSVVLYNDFDPGIASGTLSGLLGNIMTAYQAYFAKVYGVNLEKTEPITDLPEYDYAQQLEAISWSVVQQSRYAQEMAEMAPDFQMNRKGFGDINARYQNLKSDITRLDATISINAISKDRERIRKQYEMEIRSMKLSLDILAAKQKQIEEQLNGYDKNGLIYISANGILTLVGSDATGTYDRLAEKRKEVTDQITETNAKIAFYQERLNDMTGSAPDAGTETEEEADAAVTQEMSEEEIAALQETVEQKIEALVAKKNAIVSDFATMLEAYTAQEINDKTVSVSAARYVSHSLLSFAFIMRAVREAGPICAVGFMVCMVLLIISRRKEEKAA